MNDRNFTYCFDFRTFNPNGYLGLNPPIELMIIEDRKEEDKIVSRPVARTKLKTPQVR